MDQPVGQEQVPRAPAEARPKRPRRRGAWLAVAVVVALLAASGAYFMTHRVDPAAQDATFIAQVTAKLGSAPKDPAKLAATARKQCDGGAASLKYLAELIRSSNATNVETLTRIGLSVYCPDLSAEFEKDLAG